MSLRMTRTSEFGTNLRYQSNENISAIMVAEADMFTGALTPSGHSGD